MNTPNAALFDAELLLQNGDKFVDGYHQFLRVPSMRSGIYVLSPGAIDNQNPHLEDEIYFVLSGRGKLYVKGETAIQEFEAKPGGILFVKAGVIHHFYDITQELHLLVVFSSTKP